MNGEETAELPIFTRRRLIQTAVVVVALLVGIYFLFPKLVGLSNALGKLDDADPLWIAIAIGFNILAFVTYIALFKAVVGGDAATAKVRVGSGVLWRCRSCRSCRACSARGSAAGVLFDPIK